MAFEGDAHIGIDLRRRSDLRCLDESRIYTPTKGQKRSEESKLTMKNMGFANRQIIGAVEWKVNAAVV